MTGLESSEDLRKECVEHLERVESRLRARGDFRRADKVKKFRETYFMKESNFEVLEDGTIRFI